MQEYLRAIDGGRVFDLLKGGKRGGMQTVVHADHLMGF
ncbi:Uncharacterised protein [Bordetella pertussis]|nr:Uncharacterised protein [Bordetella pertussis]